MAGEEGGLSSGVLEGGVGMLMMAAVKSGSLQFNLMSTARAFRLERLGAEGVSLFKSVIHHHPSSIPQSFIHPPTLNHPFILCPSSIPP